MDFPNWTFFLLVKYNSSVNCSVASWSRSVCFVLFVCFSCRMMNQLDDAIVQPSTGIMLVSLSIVFLCIYITNFSFFLSLIVSLVKK